MCKTRLTLDTIGAKRKLACVTGAHSMCMCRSEFSSRSSRVACAFLSDDNPNEAQLTDALCFVDELEDSREGDDPSEAETTTAVTLCAG